MPGSYGPPFMRLRLGQRTDKEIIYADPPGVAVGAGCGLAVAAAVFAGGCYGLVLPFLRDRLNGSPWANGFSLLQLLLVLLFAVFWAFVIPSVVRDFKSNSTRVELRLDARRQTLEYRRAPLWGKPRTTTYRSEQVAEVVWQQHRWSNGDPYWSVSWSERGGTPHVVAEGREQAEPPNWPRTSHARCKCRCAAGPDGNEDKAHPPSQKSAV